MQQRPTRLTLLTILVALFLPVLCVCSRYARKPSTRRREAFGHFSVRQLRDHMDAINQLLIPPGQIVWQFVQQQTLAQGDDLLHHIWAVDFEDARGKSLVCMLWDADTGDLIRVGHEPRRGHAPQGMPLKNSEAVRTAWRWMRMLGVNRKAPRWIVAKAPALGKYDWIVTWHAPGYRVAVAIDQYTGDLVEVNIRHAAGAVRAT